MRDFVEVRGEGVITSDAAREGCALFGVDEIGLDRVDRQLLETLCVRYSGRPVGLSTLAVSVGEEPETIEDVYEPFLLTAGLLMRTPRGGWRRHAPISTSTSSNPQVILPIRAPTATRACSCRRPIDRPDAPWRSGGPTIVPGHHQEIGDRCPLSQ